MDRKLTFFRKETEYNEVVKLSYSCRNIKFSNVDMDYVFSRVDSNSFLKNETM